MNELFLTRLPDGGGKVKGRFDDAAMFDAIAAVIDAHATPLTAEDDRSAGERQAEALADVCGYVLDHAPSSVLPDAGGHRPHVNVLIRLDDLENRARAGCLDFGGPVPPESLRMLCCDAAVVPIVLNGKGQPLDVGRATRTIPDGLCRAVAARDRGCATPAAAGRPSWCEVHHIVEWELGGPTKLSNLVMLCRVHHRQVHSTEWVVRIRDGLPEFIPPRWIDPDQRPRRRALPHLAATAKDDAAPDRSPCRGGRRHPPLGLPTVRRVAGVGELADLPRRPAACGRREQADPSGPARSGHARDEPPARLPYLHGVVGDDIDEPCAGCGRFRAPRTDPGPTDLHWQFVTASRTAARRRWAGAVIPTPPRSPAAVCARAAAPGAHTDLTIADC